MRILKTILYLLIICFFNSIYGQTIPENPTVSGIMRSSDYPVDHFTGVPNITTPLYTMPTRSNDIKIDLSLNYHISSISSYDKSLGNCGRGWTLNAGGTISRRILGRPDEVHVRHPEHLNGVTHYDGNDIYEFNFIGFSGKFRIKYNFNTNTVTAEIFENKGDLVHVIIDHNPSTFDIEHFYIYDSKGYLYSFGSTSLVDYVDSYVHVYENPVSELFDDLRTNCKTTFYLSSITDSNYQSIVGYDYEHYTSLEDYHEPGEVNNFQSLRKITVPGYGEILFFDTADTSFDENNTITDILISNHRTTIKKFHLVYGVFSDFVSKKLIRVEESDNLDAIEQNYKMEYVSSFTSAQNVESVDKWGFYNDMNKWCTNTGIVDGGDLLDEALKTITLPTGGVIYYEFEPNTFSYRKGESLHGDIDPLFFFTDLGDFVDYPGNYSFGWNLHNFVKSPYGQFSATLDSNPATSTPNSHTFTVTGGNKLVYLKFNAEKYPSEPLQQGGEISYLYPQFQLSGPGLSLLFDGNSLYGNDENECLGTKVTFQDNGTYTLTILANNNLASGSAGATMLTTVPQSEISKFWYGGGARIKAISYFTEMPEDFYVTTPARKISYSYNFPDDPQKSSGSIMRDGQISQYSNHYSPITYKYVRVFDSQTTGISEYIYYSPLDFEDLGAFDTRLGKLYKQKIYDQEGQLLKEITFGYDFNDLNFIGDTLELGAGGNLGWIPLTTITNKDYFNGNFIESAESYVYWPSRQIKTKTKTSANDGEYLVTKYYYDANNAPDFYNRNEIQTVENYRNNKLVSVSKKNYQNNWLDPITQYVNPAYLPATTQNAKGNNAFENNLKVNRYDWKSNVLETENSAGVKTSYVWGYNYSQIIAKIEGIGYESIPLNLINNLITASNAPNITYDENVVLNALDALRTAPELSQAYFTGYTHIPLIGISVVIDSRGRRIYYEYDNMNRLKSVKDQEGNILSENEYNVKSQN